MDEVEKPKKPTIWYQPSLRQEVKSWPKTVREGIGEELNRVEYGGVPLDFKLKTLQYFDSREEAQT